MAGENKIDRPNDPAFVNRFKEQKRGTKLTRGQLLEIKELKELGWNTNRIAKKVGVSWRAAEDHILFKSWENL